jgi:hypothetical protein
MVAEIIARTADLALAAGWYRRLAALARRSGVRLGPGGMPGGGELPGRHAALWLGRGVEFFCYHRDRPGSVALRKSCWKSTGPTWTGTRRHDPIGLMIDPQHLEPLAR